MLLGRPYFAAPQRRAVAFDQGHGAVLAGTVQAGPGHAPVVTVDDLDGCLAGSSVDEDPVQPPAAVQRANSSPFIAPSLLRTFHVQLMAPALPPERAAMSALGVEAAVALPVSRLRRPPFIGGDMRSGLRSHLQHSAVDGPARASDVGRLS